MTRSTRMLPAWLLVITASLSTPLATCAQDGRISSSKPHIEVTLQDVQRDVGPSTPMASGPDIRGSYWRGAVGPGESVYSLLVTVDSVSWADWFSNPDLFVMLECEGRPPVVVPEVHRNYDGGPIVFTFRTLTLPPGGHGVVYLLDDDSVSDAVWKTLLSQRIAWSAGLSTPTGLPSESLAAFSCRIQAQGSLQILDPRFANSCVLDAPDIVAKATFEVPALPSAEIWALEGGLVAKRTQVGRLTFTHWYSEPPQGSLFASPQRLVFPVIICCGTIFAVGAFVALSRRSRARSATVFGSPPLASDLSSVEAEDVWRND